MAKLFGVICSIGCFLAGAASTAIALLFVVLSLLNDDPGYDRTALNAMCEPGMTYSSLAAMFFVVLGICILTFVYRRKPVEA